MAQSSCPRPAAGPHGMRAAGAWLAAVPFKRPQIATEFSQLLSEARGLPRLPFPDIHSCRECCFCYKSSIATQPQQSDCSTYQLVAPKGWSEGVFLGLWPEAGAATALSCILSCINIFTCQTMQRPRQNRNREGEQKLHRARAITCIKPGQAAPQWALACSSEPLGPICSRCILAVYAVISACERDSICRENPASIKV